MRRAPWSILAGLAWLAGCAGTPVATETPPLATGGPFVVVTLARPPQVLEAATGSTPRGDAAVAGYGARAGNRRAISGLSRDYGLRPMAAWPIEPIHVDCVVFATGASDPASLIDRLQRDPRVRLVEPLAEFHTSGDAPADPPKSYRGLQRNLDVLGLPAVDVPATGDGIRVAVIDTGVSLDHPDLRGAVVAHEDLVGEGEDVFRRDVHGTEVAGVIGARAFDASAVTGVAPRAQLVALKACWQRAGEAHAVCNTFSLAKAIVAAVERHSRVINLSLTGPADPLLAELLGWVQTRGIVVVGPVAADGSRRGFPAGVEGVVAVDRSESSARRPDVVYAPGDDILTLTPGGHYDFASGSSLSAAEVSGIAALLLERGAKDRRGVLAALRAAEESTTSRPAALGRDALLFLDSSVGRRELGAMR